MSPAKKDRKFRPIPGKESPDRSRDLVSETFARVIADALHREFSGTHAAVKTVAALTKSNERAAKNWFMAKNGPSGRNLVDLMRISDEVLEAVLRMCGRNELVINNRLLGSRQILIRMLNMIGEWQQASVRPTFADKRNKPLC
jgi:hypothetical protein